MIRHSQRVALLASLLGLATAAFSQDAEVCLASLLLAPSPATELKLKDGLESQIDQVLNTFTPELRQRVKSNIKCSTATQKAASAGGRLITSTSDTLLVSLQHLSELYGCILSFQNEQISIHTAHELSEFTVRTYRLSPALLSLLLKQGVEPTSMQTLLAGKEFWGALEQALKARQLHIVGLSENYEEVELRGESLSHDAFNTEISLWLFWTLRADMKQRTIETKPEPAKK